MNGAAGEEEKPCPRPPRQDQKPAQRRATPVQHATRGKQRRYFVGDVASAKLVKTQMAKSTLDAGWAMLKTMWEYKNHQAGVVFEVVNESHSTQTCPCCGVIPASGPKGGAGLGIREWVCSECGTGHDRGTNAAKNILAAGHHRLFRAVRMSTLCLRCLHAAPRQASSGAGCECKTVHRPPVRWPAMAHSSHGAGGGMGFCYTKPVQRLRGCLKNIQRVKPRGISQNTTCSGLKYRHTPYAVCDAIFASGACGPEVRSNGHPTLPVAPPQRHTQTPVGNRSQRPTTRHNKREREPCSPTPHPTPPHHP